MDDELKQYLERMEERLTERLHDTETRLLRAFADYHTGWDNRFKRIEVSDATMAERLAALETRVLRLETTKQLHASAPSRSRLGNGSVGQTVAQPTPSSLSRSFTGTVQPKNDSTLNTVASCIAGEPAAMAASAIRMGQ
jgi:hypothetical protein